MAVKWKKLNNFATNVLSRRLNGWPYSPRESKGDWLRSRWGGVLLYYIKTRLWWETAWGGCDITTNNIWWIVQFLVGNTTMPGTSFQWDTGGIAGIWPYLGEMGNAMMDEYLSVWQVLTRTRGRLWDIYLEARIYNQYKLVQK